MSKDEEVIARAQRTIQNWREDGRGYDARLLEDVLSIALLGPIPALVEGLHAQVFGVHSMGDANLSHRALADGGQIHEAVHALVRALPALAQKGSTL